MAPAPDYPLIRSNLQFELGELARYLSEPRPLETEAAGVCAAARLLRRLGLCHLLEEADGAILADRLAMSGRAYLALLGKVRWGELTRRYDLCASRAAPFFDALASGDVACAVAIARQSAPTWAEGDEYEEDFAYARALMALLGDGASTSIDLGGHLEALHRAAAESDAHRVALCDALLARSQDDLEAAFAAHAGARRAFVAGERRNPVVEPSWLATEAHVDVEALALLRLASLRGLQPPGELRFVPRAARLAALARIPEPGAWRRVAES